MTFHESEAQGALSLPEKYKIRNFTISSPTQCLPLYSLLLAVNKTEIDFLSLDIQGAELGVLRALPWDRIKIKVSRNALFQLSNNRGWVSIR